jgi:hypothetical protein
LQGVTRRGNGRVVAAALPQAEHAGRGSQLECARTLAASRLQCPLELELDLVWRRRERRPELRA